MFFKVVYGTEIHVMNSKEQVTFEQLLKFIKSVFKKLPPRFTLTYLDSDQDIICLVNDSDLQILHETGLAKVKIEVVENSEEFYDQTQEIKMEQEVKIVSNKLNDLNLQQIKEKEKDKESEKLENVEESSVSDVSEIKSLDDSICLKLNQMMPEIVSKIKNEVISQSKIKITKNTSKDQSVDELANFLPTESKVFEEEKAVHKYIICDGCEMDPVVGVRYKCAICPNFDLCENCEAVTTHDHPFLKIRNKKQTPYKIIAIIEDDKSSLDVNGQNLDLKQGLQCVKGFIEGFQDKNEKKMMKKKNKRIFKEEVKTEVSEPKIEEKVEEKVEEKMEEEKKVEEKVANMVIQERTSERKEEVAPQPEHIILDGANYLYEIMQVSFNKCYKFAKENYGLTKEELLNKFIEKEQRTFI